jgi:hypothetical protein
VTIDLMPPERHVHGPAGPEHRPTAAKSDRTCAGLFLGGHLQVVRVVPLGLSMVSVTGTSQTNPVA